MTASTKISLFPKDSVVNKFYTELNSLQSAMHHLGWLVQNRLTTGLHFEMHVRYLGKHGELNNLASQKNDSDFTQEDVGPRPGRRLQPPRVREAG